MDWIKKNSEKFTLLLFSLALLAVAVVIFLGAQKLNATFAPLRQKPFEPKDLPPLDTHSLINAQHAADNPSTWVYDSGADADHSEGLLFSSRLYVATPDGIEQPIHHKFYPPVDNDWITSHHLDLSNKNVINEDPDGDGFPNVEEFSAQTDPNDKASHPAYITKLFLVQFIQKSFRLKFDGKPDEHTFEINTIDVNQPTQFLEMGALIPGTKYKIVGYEEKHHKDPDDIDQDVSELSIENTETGKKLVLVVGKQMDDPDSYAQFRYLWPKPTKDFGVKLDSTFTIDPATDTTYKLIDINKDQAKIQNLKTNQEIVIPKLKEGVLYHAPDGTFYPDK